MDNVSIKFFYLESFMGRVIAIVSGKGGVGKTTLTANLGIMLAKSNKSVCLVDADLGLNNLDVALGLEERISYDILDVLSGNCRINQGLIGDFMAGSLYLLASKNKDAVKLITKKDFNNLVLTLSRVFDFVLIDSPAGVDFGFERAVGPAGEIIIVVTPTKFSIKDAVACMKLIKSYETKRIGVVVNRYNAVLERKREVPNLMEIQEILNEDVIGVISENKWLCVGQNVKKIYDMEPKLVGEFVELEQNLKYGGNCFYNNKKRNAIRVP